jgi:hypothetical protein
VTAPPAPAGDARQPWVRINRTSPSGKTLFVCTSCGRVSPTPDKTCRTMEDPAESWSCSLRFAPPAHVGDAALRDVPGLGSIDGDELKWLGELRDCFHELREAAVREGHAPAVIRMLEHVEGMVQATIDDAKPKAFDRRPRLWVQQLAEATTDAGSWEQAFDHVVLGMRGRLVGDEADRLGFLCRRAVHLMQHKGGSDG